MNAKSNKLISESAQMVVGSGVSAFFTMDVSMCARWLTPVGYGELVAALSISYFLTLAIGPIETGIARLRSPPLMGRMIALFCANFLHDRALRRTLRLSMAGSGLWLLLAWPLKVWLHIDGVTLFALTAYLVLLFVSSVPRAVLRGDHRFGDYSRYLLQNQSPASWRDCSLWQAASAPEGQWQATGPGSDSPHVRTMAAARLAPGLPSSAVHAKPSGLQNAPLAIAYFYFLFCVNADVLAVKHYLQATDAGLYGAVSTLSRMLYLLAIPIYQVLFSRIFCAYERGEAGWLLEPTRALSRLEHCSPQAASSLFSSESSASGSSSERASWPEPKP